MHSLENQKTWVLKKMVRKYVCKRCGRKLKASTYKKYDGYGPVCFEKEFGAPTVTISRMAEDPRIEAMEKEIRALKILVASMASRSMAQPIKAPPMAPSGNGNNGSNKNIIVFDHDLGEVRESPLFKKAREAVNTGKGWIPKRDDYGLNSPKDMTFAN